MTEAADEAPPVFDENFLRAFDALLRWRRDVRRFRSDPVDPQLIERLVEAAALAPSVGASQPWRFVLVESAARRDAALASFLRCNDRALSSYDGERAKLYASLKLAGLREAPVQFAVFCDHETAAGHGLGRATMPEMLDYSAVAAIHTLWLAARAHGLGVGWVSILDPAEIAAALDAPTGWRLIAYLCVGYPLEEHLDPELERAGWQRRLAQSAELYRR